MKQQPDKLFHKKLSSFEKPAPPDAWNRIESGLDGSKKSPAMYWRVAAAVLVVATISYLIINNRAEAPVQIAHVSGENQADVPKSPALESPPRTNSHDVMDSVSDNRGLTKDQDTERAEDSQGVKTAQTRSESPDEKSLNRSSEYSARKTNPVRRPNTSHSPTLPIDPEVTKPADSPAQIASAEPRDDATIDETQSSPARESITLVMTVDDTNAYLKKNPEEGATSGSRKTSTLKRVLQKASELKNNDQDPLGDLRQMKNEILALNFKSDKQREQKQVN